MLQIMCVLHKCTFNHVSVTLCVCMLVGLCALCVCRRKCIYTVSMTQRGSLIDRQVPFSYSQPDVCVCVCENFIFLCFNKQLLEQNVSKRLVRIIKKCDYKHTWLTILRELGHK